MVISTDTINKITQINEALKDIFEFTQKNENIKSDFDEYLLTIGAKNLSINQMEKIFLPYIFEREIGQPPKPLLEIYYEESAKDKEIAQSLMNAQNCIFEIKKILKNGFELYNLLNEKTYTVLSLTKMTNFRGVYAGQYIVARIFDYQNEYYIIEIANILSHSQKLEAIRFAIMKLIQKPQLLYKDNPEKETEIKSVISEMYQKFINTFNTNIILTTNQYADEIIGAFNDGENIDISDKKSNLTEPKFFHIKELDNNYSNFLENSMGGFSSHTEAYDVAVIFDKEKGLFAVPFYETFTKIFEGAEFENKKECIEYFLQNDAISDSILKLVSDKYTNFMDKINEILDTSYTFEDLIKQYKSEYLKNTIYSSATTLYCSKVFSTMFDIMSTPKEEHNNLQNNVKVGRNEPCPCGSGKKFKNCCGKN